MSDELNKLKRLIFLSLCELIGVDNEDHNESDYLRDYTNELMPHIEALLDKRSNEANRDFLERLPASMNNCTCNTCKLLKRKYAELKADQEAQK